MGFLCRGGVQKPAGAAIPLRGGVKTATAASEQGLRQGEAVAQAARRAARPGCARWQHTSQPDAAICAGEQEQALLCGVAAMGS
ncbi:MAG: hypothetical protein QOF84_1864 [Streptomyces sp.]|nr:hypothetical protein [Streptomyces sp.]